MDFYETKEVRAYFKDYPFYEEFLEKKRELRSKRRPSVFGWFHDRRARAVDRKFTDNLVAFGGPLGLAKYRAERFARDIIFAVDNEERVSEISSLGIDLQEDSSALAFWAVRMDVFDALKRHFSDRARLKAAVKGISDMAVHMSNHPDYLDHILRCLLDIREGDPAIAMYFLSDSIRRDVGNAKDFDWEDAEEGLSAVCDLLGDFQNAIISGLQDLRFHYPKLSWRATAASLESVGGRDAAVAFLLRREWGLFKDIASAEQLAGVFGRLYKIDKDAVGFMNVLRGNAFSAFLEEESVSFDDAVRFLERAVRVKAVRQKAGDLFSGETGGEELLRHLLNGVKELSDKKVMGPHEGLELVLLMLERFDDKNLRENLWAALLEALGRGRRLGHREYTHEQLMDVLMAVSKSQVMDTVLFGSQASGYFDNMLALVYDLVDEGICVWKDAVKAAELIGQKVKYTHFEWGSQIRNLRPLIDGKVLDIFGVVDLLLKLYDENKLHKLDRLNLQTLGLCVSLIKEGDIVWEDVFKLICEARDFPSIFSTIQGIAGDDSKVSRSLFRACRLAGVECVENLIDSFFRSGLRKFFRGEDGAALLSTVFNFIGFSGIDANHRTELLTGLLPGFIESEMAAGKKIADITAKDLLRYVKDVEKKGIVGRLYVDDIVTLDSEENKFFHRIKSMSPAGYIVEDIAGEGKGTLKGPLPAAVLKKFEEREDWRNIRQIRENGFLVVHGTNAYIKRDEAFENIERDIVSGSKYTISCSSISPLYPAGIAMTKEYSVGDVLSDGRIYAAFEDDASTVGVQGTSQFREHTRAEKLPVRLALTSDKDYNELLPQDWKMDGVYYTLKTPHEDIDKLKAIAIKHGLKLYAIDETTKHWRVYEYDKASGSFGLVFDSVNAPKVFIEAA